MYGLLNGFFIAAILISNIFCDVTIVRYIGRISDDYKVSPGRSLACICFRVTVNSAVFFFHLPAPVLLILAYLSIWLELLAVYKTNRLQSSFLANIIFTYFAVYYVICLSLASVLTGKPISTVYGDKRVWLLTLFLSLVMLSVAIRVWGKLLPFSRLRLLFKDTDRLKQITKFVLYSSAYMLFDSFFCALNLTHPMIPFFLLGSSVLLVIQINLFLSHTIKIVLEVHHETVYYQLAAEKEKYVREELRLKNLVYIDSLTGVYTRRYGMELLSSMAKDGKPFVIAYIDLDHLKQINDQLGHMAGDEYLVSSALALNQSIYKKDVLSRIGGDEFLIIFPGFSESEGSELLETARGRLAEKRLGDFPLSFSYGLSRYSAEKSVDSMLFEADSRMYEYKRKIAHREGEN